MNSYSSKHFTDLTTLPLHEILMANGYKIDRDKSSINHPCVVNEDKSQKLIITKKGENYLYFNAQDDTDRGNIISFARIRGINLKELIANYDKNISLSNNKDYQFFKQAKDLDSAYYAKQFNQFAPCDIKNNLLLKRRGFDLVYLSDYQNILKQDEHNNLIIPHFKFMKIQNSNVPNGEIKGVFICGYTKRFNLPLTKNKDGTPRDKPLNHITMGNRGIECLNLQKDTTAIKQVVLTESMIDSLSFMQIKNLNPKETLLLSTAGSYSDEQQATLKAILDTLPKARIYLAFDNDEKGLAYSRKIESFIKEENTKKYGREVPLSSIPIIYTPFSKDCNDDLALYNITKLPNLNRNDLNDWVECKMLSYKRIKDSNTKALLLNSIRKVDSLKPISEENRNFFNAMSKHKATRNL
ncbi:hypothetical protein LS71_008295 [Helicobacter jaachi]|uniref:Toprim domain-containing protein n=1 Tax=Helicobacter jaachi TaxID=1677920 RepID=A0A4U8T9K8_9HELI|nr:toprim domain-containing protein [Helicobacter jaachi]TLD95397.1 hypothetical protein LS71_008295 [Helicobacter jaachi]